MYAVLYWNKDRYKFIGHYGKQYTIYSLTDD